MQPARGDTRPCTSADCVGTMQFDWHSLNEARRNATTRSAPVAAPLDRMGWICNQDPDHFRLEA